MSRQSFKSKLKQRIIPFAGGILFIAIWPILWLCELIRPVRLGCVIVHRIGHMLNEPDLFMRRIAAGKIHPRATYIFFAGSKVCNTAALELIKRYITLLHGRYYSWFFALIRPYLSKTRFFVPMFEPHCDFAQYLPLYTDAKQKRNYYWTEAEVVRGNSALSQMGISQNDWFICFHCRDSSYLKKMLPETDWNYHNVRDSSIHSYLKAAKYIVEKGGSAIRMGAIVEDKLPEDLDPRIIDYANRHRNDFLDLYLPSKCKFFLGSNSGLFAVPATFEVPLSYANGSPATVPWGKFSMMIPQKLWHKGEKRILGFREAFFKYGVNTIHGSVYDREGIAPISNTDDEILELCVELNEIVDGTRSPNEELNRMVRANMSKGHPWNSMTTYIGSNFIKNNLQLFET